MPWWGIVLIAFGAGLLGVLAGYCWVLLLFGKSIGRSL